MKFEIQVIVPRIIEGLNSTYILNDNSKKLLNLLLLLLSNIEVYPMSRCCTACGDVHYRILILRSDLDNPVTKQWIRVSGQSQIPGWIFGFQNL